MLPAQSELNPPSLNFVFWTLHVLKYITLAWLLARQSYNSPFAAARVAGAPGSKTRGGCGVLKAAQTQKAGM